jgi:sugar phosphate isomerase/epimerase
MGRGANTMKRGSHAGLTRRQVLQLGAGALALSTVGKPLLAADKKIPIGVQLYSVRQICGKDPAGTIAAIAKMGYDGVEFAGYYGKSAAELKKILDDNGLKCCGTHTRLNTLTGDALKKTVEFNKTLGNPYLIVPGMGKKELGSVQAIKETAKRFDEIAAKLKEEKMHTGYHAHGGDFAKIEGKTKWELFFDNTCSDVVMQMDTGNCMGGGGDPVAILKKYPGRALTIHMKEHGGPKGSVIGEGKVDWKSVFEICESSGGTQWYIVEQESYKSGPLDAVKGCFEGLRKLGR